MKRDVVEYISQCQKCQQVKTEHQHPTGLLQYLPISEGKWEIICMDFIISFPMIIRQHGPIMVEMDKLSKVDHFNLVKSTHKSSDIVNIFMKKISRLHELPKAIFSDRDAKFTSIFWKGLFQQLGTHVSR